jgi:AcrR family transcriptional regulator
MIASNGSEPMPSPPTGPNESNAAVSTRRDRRIVARRTQILEAAETIFAAKGYHGTTTREIAQAADVSEGTLYNYFTSKRDLFVGLMISRTDALVESIAEVQAGSVEGAMAELLAGQFTRMREQRQFRLFLQESRLDPELNRALVQEVLPRISHEVERLMAALMDAGVMRRVDSEIANWTLMGAVVGLALFSDLGAAPILEMISVEALAAQVSDIFINGLRGMQDNP